MTGNSSLIRYFTVKYDASNHQDFAALQRIDGGLGKTVSHNTTMG